MKTVLLFFLSLSSFFIANAQNEFRNPQVITGHLIRVTPALSALPILPDSIYKPSRDANGRIGEDDNEREGRKGNPRLDPNPQPRGIDPSLQTNYATPNGPNSPLALLQNWPGLPNTAVSPADPTLAAGPNHVIQMINNSTSSKYRIWNKTGTQLYEGLLSTITGISGGGDPVAVYDQLADRFLLTEFGNGTNFFYVAVSQTPDPGGAWYIYSFSTPSFPDYPKYAMWENMYTVTSNESADNGIYAMDRAKMLAGNLTATMQRFSGPHTTGIGFQALTPVCVEGPTPNPAGKPAMFMRMQDDAWTASTGDVDSLQIWNLSIDFTTPANSVLSRGTGIATDPFDSDLCGFTSLNCIAQQGSTQKLDPIRELLMNKAIYRNFGDHESIVCNHSVDVSATDHAGVRWYELRRTGASAWTIYQQGTYSADANNRWMGSIAMDGTGAIGLAYNVSGGTALPSLRFTSRKACDPLGQMTEPETVIINGLSAHNNNRWGDYNTLTIDPSDDRTFWFTGMHMPASGGWTTRVASFTASSCAPEVVFSTLDQTTPEGTAVAPNNCLPYIDVPVTISMSLAPSQAASINFTFGGTATQGTDYTVIGNTNTTLDASNLSRTITIRIYNDALVESTESIIIGYTMNANGGNAYPGSFNQTCTISITDDDLAPVAPSTLFSDDFDAISTGLGTWTATVVSGTTNRWMVGSNGGTGFANKSAYISNNASAYSYTVTKASTTRLESPVLNTTGKNGLKLSFIYKSNGEFSGSTYYDYGTIQYSINSGSTWTNLQTNIQGISTATAMTINLPTAAENISTLKIGFLWTNDNSAGTQPPFGIDSVKLINTGQAVQTAVNAGSSFDEEYLGPNASINYYDRSTNNVMAVVTNLSSHDFGCTKVEVDRAGTAAVDFDNTDAAHKLMSKTFKITPTTNNASASIKVKLYYTAAEIAGWRAVTGQATSSCEVVKVAGNNSISSVTPGNATGFTINSAAPNFIQFGADTAFEASFNNGFSGFGVGLRPITVIPVTLLQFDGYYLNKNTIQINWSTASEQNSDRFELERMITGAAFQKIGQVMAAGNSSVTKKYQLLDKQFSRRGSNFYRLKIIDKDGRYKYSHVVELRSTEKGFFEIYPNPLNTDLLTVKIPAVYQSAALQISVSNAVGQKLVEQKSSINSAGNSSISLNKLPAGIYLLEIRSDKENLFTTRLVKEQ